MIVVLVLSIFMVSVLRLFIVESNLLKVREWVRALMALLVLALPRSPQTSSYWLTLLIFIIVIALIVLRISLLSRDGDHD